MQVKKKIKLSKGQTQMQNMRLCFGRRGNDVKHREQRRAYRQSQKSQRRASWESRGQRNTRGTSHKKNLCVSVWVYLVPVMGKKWPWNSEQNGLPLFGSDCFWQKTAFANTLWQSGRSSPRNTCLSSIPCFNRRSQILAHHFGQKKQPRVPGAATWCQLEPRGREKVLGILEKNWKGKAKARFGDFCVVLRQVFWSPCAEINRAGSDRSRLWNTLINGILLLRKNGESEKLQIVASGKWEPQNTDAIRPTAPDCAFTCRSAN